MTIHLTKKQYTILFVSLWVVFAFLVSGDWMLFGVRPLVGVVLLVCIGVSTLFALRLDTLPAVDKILLTVPLSIFALILTSLVANVVLPVVFIPRPLDTVHIFTIVVSVAFALYGTTYKRLPEYVAMTLPRYVVAHTKKEVFFTLTPIFLTATAIVGALHLNEGGSNTPTMTMLLGIGIYMSALSFQVHRLSPRTVYIGIFFSSLALLLMTSLRGWFVTGHDIQREFFVFTHTQEAGVWSMDWYRDAYNACLSITILPTVLSNLLDVSGVFLYKVLYQIVFALVPLFVYRIAHMLFDVRIALLATFYFIAFPTFFQDMPFLVRQEIAFLFFAAMLLFLFHTSLGLMHHRILFVLMGIGLVLSHYSTTYIVLFALAGTVLITPVFQRLYTRIARTEHTAIVVRRNHDGKPLRVLTWWMVFALAFVGVWWTSGITKTGGHARDVATEFVAAIRDGFDGSNRSGDALRFFTFNPPEQNVALDEYVEQVVAPLRSASPDEFFATGTYAQYQITTLPPDTLPVTALGAVHVFNVPLATASTFLGRLLIKVLEIAIVCGLWYVLWRATFIRNVDSEYYVLAGVMVLFVVFTITLPVLSIEYGVFRALLQSLMVVGVFVVVGTVVCIHLVYVACTRIWHLIFRKRTRVLIAPRLLFHGATYVVALFFFYTTGFVPQLVGGSYPSLHLNDTGNDYDHYVTLDGEQRAIRWLDAMVRAQRARGSETNLVIQADRYGQKKLHALINAPIMGSIYPGVVTKDSYVFLTAANVKKERATVTYKGRIITYTYPLEFLETNKELVYDNGVVRIYR